MEEIKRLLEELSKSANEVAEDNFREYPDRGSINDIANESQYTINRILKLMGDE